MSEFEIYRMTPPDWERVKRVRLRALADSPDAFGSTFDLESEFGDDRWQARLANPDSVTFLLSHRELGDVGISTGAPYTDRTGAGLFSMWVAPEVRGRRLGEKLIASVIDWAMDEGYELLRLEVGDRNQSAIRLYRRMRFKPSGRTGTLAPPREHITEHELVLRLEKLIKTR